MSRRARADAEARAAGGDGARGDDDDLDAVAACSCATWSTERLDLVEVELLAAVGEQVGAELGDDAPVTSFHWQNVIETGTSLSAL